MAWKSMDSAPKDQKRFLAVCEDGHICFARWDGWNFVIVNNGDYHCGGYGNDYTPKPENEYSDYEPLTHWQPLPKPPRELLSR